MIDFRVEKRRTRASLSLTTRIRIEGSFFLADHAATHRGRERIADLLNGSNDFFPFELESAAAGLAQIVLLNRAHVVVVHVRDPELTTDPNVSSACRKVISLQLSTGLSLSGVVPVIQPAGHDRLSDYARSDEHFRYLDTDDGELIVNFSHVVQMLPLSE